MPNTNTITLHLPDDFSSPWDFIMRYLPNYYQDDTVTYSDDLAKLIEKEFEQGDAAYDILKDQFNGDANNPKIQKEYDLVLAELALKAVEGFLIHVSKQ